MENQKNSILEMARGAFIERVDYEMDKVVNNILDINTKPTAKRKITLTLEFVPDDSRKQIGVAVQAKTTLAPTSPVTTSLYVTKDELGADTLVELVPQVPGQMAMDGTEQEEPAVLKVLQRA